MKSYQEIPYALPSQTFSLSARTTQTLRDLPKQYLGRLCHLSRIGFSVVSTPTYSGTISTVQLNNFFTAVDFWDGSYMRFQGGLNHMRQKERLQTGRNRVPDETPSASTTSSYFRRTLHVGHPGMAGSPSDFAIPCGMLENGELRFTHGALADLGSVNTVETGSCRVTAFLLLMDELRIPPAYQFTNQAAGAADINLSGRALYTEIAILDSAAFGNFAAGELGNIRLDLGQGDVVPAIKAADLTHGFNDAFASGDIGGFTGDPESATLDAGARQVNRGTPTALEINAIDCQPVLWTVNECRISKLFLAESVARLRWDGSQSTAVILVGRILPQPQSVVAANVSKALGRLNLTHKQVSIKTLSKEVYNGPYKEFMPWKVSV